MARRYLAHADNPSPSCPSITELCRQTNDYVALAEVAREQGDPVHFMAGLLAARQNGIQAVAIPTLAKSGKT